MGQVLPVMGKNDGRENKSEDDIDDNSTGKGPEWFGAGRGQFAEAGGQADGKETEDKGPGSQRLNWSDQHGFEDMVIGIQGVMAGDQGHND